MSKRSANTDLNSDNWNQEDPPEEAGTFKTAPDEILNKRVIRTAKRRSIGGTPKAEGERSIFSSFSGFGKTSLPTADSVKGTFNFLSNSNGINNSQSSSNSCNSNNNNNKTEPKRLEMTETTKPTSEDYSSRLKALNESVVEWMKMHVNKNPFCILTPIFRDYEKYLDTITKETNSSQNNQSENKESVSGSVKLPNSDNSEQKNNFALPIFGNSKFSTPLMGQTSPFASNLGDSSSTFKTNVLGNTKNTFSFGSGPPAMFMNVEAEKKNDDDEEEIVQEKPKIVKEDDSIFSKRVKVFFKKPDGEEGYSDRGVGTLYVKEVSGGKKHQMVVRADTSLGNVLLNFLLTKDVPMRRVGKNNVLLICLPTPDAKPPPITVLLRAKTAEEANSLIEHLSKFAR